MVDFIKISTRSRKQGVTEIYPKFIINNKSSDLMIRGGDFYAIWVEERGLWSTDEQDVVRIIDRELSKFAEEYKKKSVDHIVVLYMWDAESGSIDSWHKYCQKQMRDNFHPLDENLIFSNTPTKKEDYASKKLSYPLEDCNISAYDHLISTLYSEEERHKIEWGIGAIVDGASKYIQKFMVFYGSAGTGKSTILNIIQELFEGYYSVFDAKALGSSSNSFALEAFKTNPLIAIQHDGDLSRIEDNTRLNSLVSHELMTVNEKFKSTYSNRFNAFLLMGTNKPVRITDGKSGLIRRLIDVSPTGNKLSGKDYRDTMEKIKFELGGIAKHCLEVYQKNPNAYDDYIPTSMLGASNDFYNFVIDSWHVFSKEDGTTLKAAWEMYKVYCDDAKVPYPYSKRNFKEELKNYFREFNERFNFDDGTRVRSYYSGFRKDKFETEEKPIEEGDDDSKTTNWLVVDDGRESIFDKDEADCLAQYATSKETPSVKWKECRTRLRDIDTSRLHYVKVPENHIVIDFDIKDENGEKSFEKNIAAASKWPPTYAEVSKGGAGIHLHYIYNGDVSKLSRVYDENIEIKVFTGKSSLRRKLTKCNGLTIATISSGLPLKEGDNVINFESVKNEKAIRTLIKKNLNKEYHPGTKPSIDFINKILEDAYESGITYDVSDMTDAVVAFAANSSHQADYCLNLVTDMKFKSEEPAVTTASSPNNDIVFYDVEVFPNLFLINWKTAGSGQPVVRMINPTPSDVEELLRFKLVGFNCRRYDNHILHARLMGYSNEELFHLSQRIINNERDALFSVAYGYSYTDVYDFASAGNKKSLKKLEIEMSNKANDPKSKMDDSLRALLKTIKHQELGLPWDKPVPKELWTKVAEYCDNDVLSTEAAFYYLEADWTARQILADLADMTVNDSTNSLTAKIIFNGNKEPQSEFNYRDLSKPVMELDDETKAFLEEACPKMMSQRHGEAKSLLPYFPGYKFEYGKSTYRGEVVGEGGWAEGNPGMYINAALLDIVSMHPHSAIAEVLFGIRYTKAFRDIVEGRVSIKHKAWDEVNHMLDGKLTPYIQRVIDGEMTAKALANALKTAINSVYGLTSASFKNPFRDVRNVDNIVAKRGALFMLDLREEVRKRGFTVAHIKTDSIKIPNATPEIIKFVMEFGEKYGYTFEHEATYDRMCIVNDAVYIAKYKDADDCKKMYGYIPGDNEEHGGEWTATGKQFAVPYLFKTLFSKEPIVFEDMCETFSVSKGNLYLDMNENIPQLSHEETKELEVLDKAWHSQAPLALEKAAKRYGYSLEELGARYNELCEKEEATHDLQFVGRVGQFTPIKAGCNGGILYRVSDGKNYSATGSTGYRWLESEMVKTLGKEDCIDRTFYTSLIDDAVESISQYCDFERFVADEPFPMPDVLPDFMNIPEGVDEELPFN